MRRIYLDHNAGSPMPEPVREALAEAFARAAGNPGSPHAEGQEAKRLLEEARSVIAAFAGARPSEVIFTSGGTEANNAAIRGILGAAVRGNERAARRIVTSCVEHPSVLEACEAASRATGTCVTRLPVDGKGLVDPGDLRRSLAEAPADLVSIMHANNETGVIQPIHELAQIAREAGVLFHSDLVQAAGKLDVAEAASGLSAFTLAAHKIGGPPGIGALILREGTPFEPLVAGGAQEGRRRAGTEPAALAAGFARAVLVHGRAHETGLAWEPLRDGIEEAFVALSGRCRIHGAGAPRVGNTTNVYFPEAPGRLLVIRMDLEGFAVSTGSACSTGSSMPSHVLRAMGCSESESMDSLRVSLGPETTGEELSRFVEALGRCVEAMRAPGGRSLAGAEVA